MTMTKSAKGRKRGRAEHGGGAVRYRWAVGWVVGVLLAASSCSSRAPTASGFAAVSMFSSPSSSLSSSSSSSPLPKTTSRVVGPASDFRARKMSKNPPKGMKAAAAPAPPPSATSLTLEKAMIYYKLEAPEIAMAQRAVRTPDGKYTQLTLEQERAAIAAVVYGREMLTTLEGLRGAGKKGKGKGTAATEQNEAELPALDKWAGALGLSSADLRRRLAMALAAKQVLISSNIPLVYGVVSKHFGSLLRTSKGSGLNMEDLVQEGIMGLSRAAEIYDAERSVRFGTYAWSWVRSYVGEYINLAAHATRVPRYFNTSLNAITRQLREELGRAPTTQEVADAAGVDLRTTGLIYGNAISLNKVMRSGKEIGDLVVGSADDDVSLDWEETAAEAGLGTGLQGDLQSIITSELTVKEAEMLKLRFGLEDGRPRTIVDCAKALLVSRNKANQLLSNGLDKLRKLAEGHSDELVLSKVL